MHALLALVLLAAPDAPTALRGTVKDDQGQPLADVLVSAAQPYDRDAVAKMTRTDAAGRYELRDLPPGDPRGRVQVLALKHGLAAGTKLLNESDPPGQLDFVLPPAKVVSVTVVDPAGQPVAEAEVLAVTLIQGGVERGRSAGELQPAVLRAFPLRSDAAGKLQIDFLPPETYFALEVSAQGFGRQRDLWQLEDMQHPLRLRAVGSLAGTLKPPAGKSPEGLRVQVEVRRADEPYFIAWGSAVSDAAGKFAVPEIAAGNAVVRVESDSTKPVRPGPTQNVVIEAGKGAAVELALNPVVEVTGTVVDLASGEPIAGAKVSVHNYTTHRETTTVTTDAKGAYRTSIGGGTIGADVQDVAPPHYPGVQNRTSAKSGGSDTSVQLPPLKVPRGARREGTVVDADGKPVAAAWITAMWREEQDGLSTLFRRDAASDDAGRFAFDAVSSRVETYFQAETQDQATVAYVALDPGSKEPLMLTVSKAGTAVVQGRVVAERGSPLAGATVTITGVGRRGPPSPRPARDGAGEWSLRTDSEGRFATPVPLPRTLAKPAGLERYVPSGYRTTISAPGRLAQAIQLEVGQGSPFVFPDITLQRVGLIQGRVVGRQGQALAGVAIHADGTEQYRPAMATSDADGRFTLKTVHPDALFLFARHADYVFTGAAIPQDGAEVKLVIARATETATDPPLAPRRPSSQETIGALHLLLPRVWDKLDPKEGLYGRMEVLKAMAPHDAEWATARLPQIGSPRYQIEVLRALGLLEEAVGVVAGLKSADERSRTYTSLAELMKIPGRSRELLGEAVVEARTIIDPTRRLSAHVRVARVLHDLGDKEAARKIIDEQLPQIEKLEAGFWRGYMAETVALFDIDRALKLCEGATDEYERDRHPGNIAHLLAARDPARAETIVKSLTERNQYRYIAPVCYRMAAVDLPRAKRIADGALPSYDDPKPYAYAVMAQAICDQQPQEARDLLRRGFELLPNKSSGRGDIRRTFGLAVILTHLSETVDPAATREYVWRTIALAAGTHVQPTTEWDAEEKFRADGHLAVLLARYGLYPEVAARLVEPLYTTDKLKPQRMREDIFPMAMAMVDPTKAADWLDRYIAAAKGDELRYIPQPWELMAPAAAGDDAAFWEAMHRHVLHRWWPDVEDF